MRLWLHWGVVAIVLSVGFAYSESDDLMPELRRKSSLLQSLTAQLHQLFLQTDEKEKEAESRVSEAPFLVQGRLTAVSGSPVPAGTTANVSTIYFSPYKGSRVTLYTGSAWVIHAFTERSIALSGLTASRNYDVFVYNTGTTLALELSAAWTNNSTRADALLKQDGVYVKNSATTRRYLGTIRTTSATQTQDTEAQRFIWNYYNRVRRPIVLAIGTNNWAYNTGTWRGSNADNTQRVEYVIGENEVPISMKTMVIGYAGATVRNNVSISFGLDTDGRPNSYVYRGGNLNNEFRQQLWSERAELNDGLGYHFLQALEYGANSVTFLGDGGDARLQAGMVGWIDG